MNFKELVLMNLQTLTNFPYIEKDFDAVTDYELLCLVVDHLNEVIKNSNEQNTVIQSLYNAFVSLKDYVDNYFDNLDIQEEVDNKLDEMAESGELADIIAQYLEVASVLAYDTKASLKSADNLVNGSITRTLGEDTYNDGKGSYYKIRTITSSDVIDDDNILALANYPTLIAEKIVSQIEKDVKVLIESPINVKLYGVKGDGVTDDSTAIQDIIDNNGGKTIYFPDGTYLVNNKINIYNDNIVDIKCSENTYFISSEEIECFFDYGLGERPEWRDFRRHIIDGGNYDCSNATYGIILNSRSHLNYVKNVNMNHIKNTGLYLKKHQDYESGDCLIENISITGETSTGLVDTIGIHIESFDNELNNIRIQGTTIGIKISGAGNKIYNAHPLFIGAVNTKEDYERSIGFLITTTNKGWNEFTCCYADSFNTGFKITGYSINNITNGKCNTYITPLQDLQNQFIWVTDSGAFLNLIGCKYYPSDPPVGITYTARIIRCDGFAMDRWYAFNKLTAIACDWAVKSFIPDNDPAYGLKSNNIKSFQYTFPYATTMQQDKYYKIALINVSQSLQKIHINNGYEGEWDIEMKWHSAASPSAGIFHKVTKLFNPIHNLKLALCDTFTENGILYGYLCVKATDTGSSLTFGFQNYTGGANGELFTAFEKFGVNTYTPTTIVAETNLY